jgi:hypothetical protein
LHTQAFDNFCTSIGFDVKHYVAHVHNQNGPAESFISAFN